MVILIASIVGGLVGLFIGGELLVRGAVSIANRLGISHLVTGLVIVGAATSMPEMVASVQAALAGSPGIAWGNIVGSNLANTLLILGATALVAPIVMHGVGKRDAVVGLLATLLFWGIASAQLASVWIGFGLLAALAAYVVWRINHPPELGDDDDEGPPLGTFAAIALFLVGLGILVGGGALLVDGAIELATIAGVSDAVIGLTVVAVGTSLPELAASLAAALKGRPDMAIGNVVGSNIYNLLLIGGATMTIAPLPVSPEILDIEVPVLAASAVLMLLLCRYAKRIGRVLGLLLLAAFAGNTALLFV
ncbi:calcium/sodium antiporter [Aurantiacibacter aquimixticola]|uniref:Sodium:calcium antiporter n=1 Tax=Aurantiacibacter aquimixticola TaxID=1958945 RepID=A0A419RR11_9SPHN|nr:calcium/sodium antiporter [Aurantiacibacter aquimixticola]RJY08221.1 sodium:calcium antiporter [Aurantiacibacter aquimixticola]